MTRLGTLFTQKDWLPGLLGILAVLGLHVGTDGVQSLERQWYDHGVQASHRAPAADVAVIAIDDASIARLGPWPWSRDLSAQLIERLSSAGARSIVWTPPLVQPQAEAGLTQLQNLATLVEGDAELATHPVLPLLLQQSRKTLDADARLAQALAESRRVLLTAWLSASLADAGLPALKGKLPPSTAGRLATARTDWSLPDLPAGQWPLANLADAAAGLGQWSVQADADGVLRSPALWVQHAGRMVPSIALLAAVRHAGGPEGAPRLLPERSLQWGALQVPVEAGLRARLHVVSRGDGSGRAIPHDPFHAVLSGEIPASRFARKTVLVGLTANGLTPTVATPAAAQHAVVDVVAQQVSALLRGQVVRQPGWGGLVNGLQLLGVLAYLVLLVPRLATRSALALSAVLSVGLLALGHLLLTQASLWIASVLPVAALLGGHAAMLLTRLVLADEPVSDAAGVQSMHRLGESLLARGQHDLAWEQLRGVPLALLGAPAARALMDRLYDLGRAFEDQQRLEPAREVWAHLVRHDQAYRDVAQRLLRLRSAAADDATPPAADAAQAAEPAADAPAAVLPLTAEAAAPAAGWPLGRFLVQAELARGAMGAVYQGIDSRTRRPVAIKTMALSQEFSGEHLADARQRFLREAETAGRLHHPDIVAIIDAGEDRDLAYIAMELLPGHDLTRYTRPGQLLPVAQVLRLVARIADALDYAHKHGVVHRDIKPANVMVDPARDLVKVTDFGIARITDANKTRTGAVLGTPSYMSPEQLAGRRLDGRSDLYSLGVMLFQLLTGQLPMRGDSMAELMYAIANTPAQDIRQVRPELPQTLAEVVALALEKRPEVRYADGHQLAMDLRTVAEMMEHAAATPPPAPPVPPVPLAPAPAARGGEVKAVRGVWRSAVRKARSDAQAELFADTQPSMPMPLDDDGFGHNRSG